MFRINIVNNHNIEGFKTFQLHNLFRTKCGNFHMDDYHFKHIAKIIVPYYIGEN